MSSVLKQKVLAMAAAWCAFAGASRAENLLENGAFDHPEGALRGWHTDYAWSGNKHYAKNAEKVHPVPQPGGKGNAIRLLGDGGAGVKMESAPLPFDPACTYDCSLDVKGGPYRVYLAGYKWKPGVRPHEAPRLEELRMVYKSKAAAGSSSSWKRETTRLPGTKPSPMALEHLRQVRFLTVYVYFMEPGYVDNVTVTRTRQGPRGP
jgi:hypothetical protein